jgi:RimJ/RimL family protein N-acetyltransferase
MQAPGPTLETERLILRPTSSEDFDPWAAMMADEETARFIGGVSPRSVAWRQVCTMAGSWTIVGYGMFSVIEKATGLWIGRLGPWQPADWPGSEVGWGLTRASWGKGYAVEGAIAAMDWTFDTLDWTEIIHSIAPDNLPSAKVAERLGSKNWGPGKMPPPYEASRVDIWGQTREEWTARRRAR